MVRTNAIGCGNMGSALLTGFWKVGGHSVAACDFNPDALAMVVDYCEKTTDDVLRAADAGVVLAAVEPDTVEAVLPGLDLSPGQTLVTIAAGASTLFVGARTDARVIHIMPNLAAETRDMAAATTDDLTGEVREFLSDVGEFVEVEESQMNTVTAVNGSGPAFVSYLIKAVTQAGVMGGFSEEDAGIPAAQTFKGAVETVVQDDRTADELTDVVCSPNGMTIEGMEVLWDSDADDAVTEMVIAAECQSKELVGEFAGE